MKNLRIQINLSQYLQLQDTYKASVKAAQESLKEGEDVNAPQVPSYLDWLSNVLQTDTLEVVPN